MKQRKPKYFLTKEIFLKFKEYYEDKPLNLGIWGSLHIVLEDANIKDHFVKYCIEFAEEQNDSEGLFLANELMKMSQRQRLRIHYDSYRIENLKDNYERIRKAYEK